MGEGIGDRMGEGTGWGKGQNGGKDIEPNNTLSATCPRQSGL